MANVRLIDANALIKDITESVIEVSGDSGLAEEAVKCYQAVILKYIDTIPTSNPEDCRPQWISVEDRLPDLIPCNAGTAYSEAVIVWTSGKKAMIAVWDGVDFLCAADYWEAWGENITHWMPLPEPPKEKMDGKEQGE